VIKGGKLIIFLNDRSDITVIEYFFVVVLVVVGIIVVLFRYLL
jgi:Flp pilus assembly pilin Flp